MDFLRSRLMERVKLTALTNLYALMKMPLLAFITPEIREFTEERVVIRVRLGIRTRNHLKSMYFGSLAMGSELSIAAAAVHCIYKSGKRIDFIFKDFQANFTKRADGHVLFEFEDVAKINALIQRAGASTERMDETFTGIARVEGGEQVMSYRLTISVRSREQGA